MTQQDYLEMSATREVNGSEKVEELPLAEDEIIINGTPAWKADTLELLGQTYQVKRIDMVLNENDRYMAGLMGGYYYVVVKDDAVLDQMFRLQREQLGEAASDYEYVAYVDIDGNKAEREACANVVRNDLYNTDGSYEGDYMGDNGCARLVVESRAENYGDFFSTYGSLLFLGLFLGTMFLMITVLIIFYKQISEGYDDKERFQILEKVGMSNTEVKRTISSQIRIVFFLPILAAAIHVLAAFPMICRLMLILNLTNTELFIWCLLGTVAVFGIIYLIVFRITSKNYYRIVKNMN